MVNRMRLMFVCFTPYQLTCSIIYCKKISHRHPDLKKVLVWKNFSNCKIDIHFVARQFDEIIEIPTIAENQNIIVKQFKKLIYYGRLFPFTNAGKKIRMDHAFTILCVYSDQELMTNRILKMFRKDKHITTVLLDEGLHLYDEPQAINRSALQKINNFILGITYAPYIGYSSNIDTIIAKFPLQLPNAIIKDRSIIQQGNICRYSEDWDFILSSSEMLKGLSKMPKPLIMYLGQPIISEGVSEEKEIAVLEKVFAVLSDEYTILLKPHPRDRLGKYDSLISSDILFLSDPRIAWIPAEIIAGYLSPVCIMSSWSSSCNTLEIPLIYLYPLMGMLLKNSALEVKRPNILCIENFEQLSQINVLLCMNQLKKKDKNIINGQDDITYFNAIVENNKNKWRKK